MCIRDSYEAVRVQVQAENPHIQQAIKDTKHHRLNPQQYVLPAMAPIKRTRSETSDDKPDPPSKWVRDNSSEDEELTKFIEGLDYDDQVAIRGNAPN